jgi:putative hydrolase of the HAD superfamily
MLDSHEEGVEKPDPRLFEIALERSGAQRGETLHVGDLYHVDVQGARGAGLDAVLLDPADLYAGFDCRRIRSLGELPGIIEERRQRTSRSCDVAMLRSEPDDLAIVRSRDLAN